MKSFSQLLVGAYALATLVQAAPINVVTVTDLVTVTTWTTVDAVATVWVSGDQSPAALTTSSTAPVDPSAGVFAPSATSTTASSPTTVATIVVTTTTAPVVVTPQPTTTFTTTTPAVTPVTTQPTTTVQTTTTTTNTPYAPATTTGSSGSAPAGPCVGQGNACTGDITHWDGGLGACGWNVNTDSDMQIALPVGLMGSLSNSNPYCGKSVSIYDPTSGVTIQATVGDKCMGCAGDAIDLTNAAFNAVTANQGDGRVHGIQWWFN